MAQLVQDRFGPNTYYKKNELTVIDSSLVTGAPLFVDSSAELFLSSSKFQSKYTGKRDSRGYYSGNIVNGQLAIIGGSELWQAHFTDSSILWKQFYTESDSSVASPESVKGSIIYVSSIDELTSNYASTADKPGIVEGNLAVVGVNTLYQADVDAQTGNISWHLSTIATAGTNIIVDASGNYLDNVYFDPELEEFDPSTMYNKFPDEFLVISSSEGINGEPTPSWSVTEALSSLIIAVNELRRNQNLILRTFDNGVEGSDISDISSEKSLEMAFGSSIRQPIIKVDTSLYSLADETPNGTDPVDSCISGYAVDENGNTIDASVIIYNDNILDSSVYPYENLGAESEVLDASSMINGINPGIPDGSLIDASTGEYLNYIDPGTVLYNTDPEKIANLDTSAFVMRLKHWCPKVAKDEATMNKFMYTLYPNELVLCLSTNALYRYNTDYGEMQKIIGGNSDISNPSDGSTPDTSNNDYTIMEILQALTDGSVNEIVFRDIDNSSLNSPQYSVGISGGQIKILEAGGTQLTGTASTKPIRLDTTYVSNVISSTLLINEIYAYSTDASGNIDGIPAEHNTSVPVSHNFIELANLDPYNDVDLSNINLQYFDGTNVHTLFLRGKIKSGSTFLIRGAQVAAENSATTVIDVSTYDMQWIENGAPLAMHNDYGTLYLSLDILDSSGNINVSATESILPNMSDITSSTLNYTAPGASNFIDMVSWQSNSATNVTLKKYVIDPITNTVPVSSSRLIVRNYELDRSQQANPTAFSKISNKFWDYVDLDYDYLGNEADFRPRSSDEKKNIYTTRSYFRSQLPYMVTCSFGIDAETTRTFNWVTASNDNQYLFYRIKDSSDAWTIKESYQETDEQDTSMRTVSFNYADSDPSVSGIITSGGIIDTIGGQTWADSSSYSIHIPVYDRIKWESSGKTFMTTHKVIVKNNVTTDINGSLTRLDSSLSYFTDYTLTTPSITPTQYTKGLEYEYLVGPASHDEYGTITGPDTILCSDLCYFQVRKKVTDASWNFIQHTDEQGFNFREYETWRRTADIIRAQFNPQFTVNTGDMTQNGNRISEWLDYYNGVKNLATGKQFKKQLNGNVYSNDSAGAEQMNVVGNNDLSPIHSYLLGNGDDSVTLTNTEGKVSPKQFNYFYCYEIDPECMPAYFNSIKDTTSTEIVYQDSTGTQQTMSVNLQRKQFGHLIPSCYSYNYNNCHFIGICSELTQAAEYQEYGAVMQDSDNVYHTYTNDLIMSWLQKDLDKWYKFSLAPASTAVYPWCIAYMHEMPYTTLTKSILDGSGRSTGGSKLNDNVTNQFELSEIFQENHVPLILGGHKHTHMSSWPIFENVHYEFGLYMKSSDYSLYPDSSYTYTLIDNDKSNYKFQMQCKPVDASLTTQTIDIFNYVSDSDLPLGDSSYHLLTLADTSSARIQASNNMYDIYPWEANEKILSSYNQENGNILRIVNPSLPYFVISNDVSVNDPSLYHVYHQAYTNPAALSTEGTSGFLKPNRFKSNGICLLALDASSAWAPVYNMCQASGNKVTSNKDIPSINIPWAKWYTPAQASTSTKGIAGSDDAYTQDIIMDNSSQKWPYFMNYVFVPDASDPSEPGNIEIHHYRINKQNFADFPQSQVYYPENETNDPLAVKGWLNNNTYGYVDTNMRDSSMTTSLGTTINYQDTFPDNFKLMSDVK